MLPRFVVCSSVLQNPSGPWNILGLAPDGMTHPAPEFAMLVTAFEGGGDAQDFLYAFVQASPPSDNPSDERNTANSLWTAEPAELQSFVNAQYPEFRK